MDKLVSRRGVILGIIATPLSLSAPEIFSDASPPKPIAPAAGWQKYTVTNWIDGIGMGWCVRDADTSDGVTISTARSGVRELRRVLQPGDRLWGRVNAKGRFVTEFAPPIPSHHFLNIFAVVADHYGCTVSSLVCAGRHPTHAVAMYFALRHAKTTPTPGKTMMRGFGDCLDRTTVVDHYIHAWTAMSQRRARSPSLDRDIAELERKLRAQGYDFT